MDKESLKLGGILGGIALCVALLLSVVNSATADVIAKRTQADETAALQVVMPSAGKFKETKAKGCTAYDALADGKHIGWCIKTSSPGYGGDITVIVGIKDGKVEGVSITDMDETPGLGARASEESFISQYKGKSGKLAVSKDGGKIEAISGATITSRAVTEAVNKALAAAEKLDGGVGNGK